MEVRRAVLTSEELEKTVEEFIDILVEE